MKKRLNLIKTRKTSGFDALKKPIQSIHSNKSPEKLRHSLDSWFLGFWTGCRNGILSYSSKRPSITIFLSDLVHKLRCPSTSAISCLAVLARSGERCQPFGGGKASQILAAVNTVILKTKEPASNREGMRFLIPIYSFSQAITLLSLIFSIPRTKVCKHRK